MSARIYYSNADKPPFPQVDVGVASWYGEHYLPAKGKIDTGSVTTVIPDGMVRDLNLKVSGSKRLKYGEEIKEVVAYSVLLKIGPFEFDPIKAISSEGRKTVLLGRDLLNLVKMSLDGKTKSGEIIQWSKNPEDAYFDKQK